MKTILTLTTFVVFLLIFLLTLGMAQDNHNKLDRLEPLERIFEISPGFNRDHMEALRENGFDSAPSIARMGQKDFVKKANALGIKADIAISIHEKATKIMFEKKLEKIAPYKSDKNAGPQKYKEQE